MVEYRTFPTAMVQKASRLKAARIARSKERANSGQNTMYAVTMRSTKPELAEQIVAECAEAGIERIWFQRGVGKGSATKKAIDLAREKGLEVVHGVCPMMFFGEPGFHGFHFKMRRFFGGLPKEWAEV